MYSHDHTKLKYESSGWLSTLAYDLGPTKVQATSRAVCLS